MSDAKEYPLEPGPAETRAMAEAVLALVQRFLDDLPELPAFELDGAAALAAALREPAPEHGSALPGLLDTVAAAARSGAISAGPGYLAYVPGGGLYTAALADFLVAALNKYVTVWQLAPACAQIEATAVRWLCDLFGHPAQARGILTSGGSMANFSAIVTARTTLLGEDFLDGTAYVTDQTHASCAKAALLAGIPRAHVRVVPARDNLAMDPHALAAAIEADRRAGLRPFLVIGSAGTTNTGAVDPLADLAAAARDAGAWFHVDAAYGGPFQLTERGRSRLRGIELADSITIDPHKAMFLPYGTGALLVRDGVRLRQAHHVGAEYLQDLGEEADIPNFTEYSPELTREWRGLRLWLPIKLHGLAAFRQALDEKLDLAELAYEGLREYGFEVPWRPDLTAVAFRWVPEHGDADAFNAELLRRVTARRRALLSSTRIGGRYMIGVCVVSHRTHRDRVEEVLDILRETCAELRAERG
ncbi:pyridoxal phosphate-dependent decarboxylase family protein [Nonomuraea gerenzanensis]|uniref:Aromatic-L-amino-acid decarboxylase n=1 Tax=Nonomuraea gerenzanensis TaxID=93944 RepID=A0A1M4EG24_9ACTN|nr:aminotransferase class V-fold PLP-dependent enzyme [Nonomuraea gerenzanensis]UBU09224.1 aminotransferase class V-fold PLP-dependent enzyme [Nonomuraea gerenzanensis]SBO97618.1 Aromatic-L-amino-acid decarboxylase [Nonomuraea gerenzanensis]